MTALLALIPAKDWFIGAAFAVLACTGWHYYEKYTDAVNYATTVKAESAAALADAKTTIAGLTLAYNTGLTNLQAASDAKLKAANTTHLADVDRLQRAAAARATDPVLQGSAGAAAEAAAWASRLGALESISAGLANALRADDIAANDCRAERDSVTSK